jgi:hypothetical protein
MWDNLSENVNDVWEGIQTQMMTALDHTEIHAIRDKGESLELTEANWDPFQRDHPMAFVNFYAPWAI